MSLIDVGQPGGPPSRAPALARVPIEGVGDQQSTPRKDGDGDAALALARAPFYLGVLTIPMLAIRPVGGITLSDDLFAVSLAVSLMIVPHVHLRVNLPWLTGAALIAIGGLLAAEQAVAPFGSLAVTLRLLFLALIWQWQARKVLRTRHHLERAIVMFTVGAAASATVGVAQVTVGLQIFGSTLDYGRATGLGEQPNNQGAVLAIAIAMVAAQIAYRRRRGLVLVSQLGLLGICAVGLILSGSLSSMAATLVALIVVLVRRSLTFRLVAALAALGAVSIFGASQLQQSLHYGPLASPLARLSATTTGGLAGENSITSRLGSYKVAWSRIQAHPLTGVGLDTPLREAPAQPAAHDVVLLLWSDGGVFTLAGFLVIAASSFRLARRRRPSSPGGLHEMIVAGAVAATVYALSSPIAFQRFFWLPLVLFLCEPSWCPNLASDAHGEEKGCSPARRPAPSFE